MAMELKIQKAEKLSRGQLLLRTFFGALYIAIPHVFVMIFVAIWAAILGFLAWWVILFTGKYPQSWFELQVKLQSWSIRLSASLSNMIDGYPQIGLKGSHPMVTFTANNPEKLSRGMLLVKTLFGFIYVSIPHVFCLLFRIIWGSILSFLAWWVILFTAKYPQSWFEYQEGTLRWQTRVGLYLANMTDEYPPFSGK